MIILDANILIYSWNEANPEHRKAKVWVESLLSGKEWVGLPWQTAWAFIRLTTNSRLFPRPLAPFQAIQFISELSTHPNVICVEPQGRHLEILLELMTEAQARGPLVSDAVLAAIAIEQGAQLASTDRDFRRFRGLRLVDPLHDQ